jgi:hypothetical protein
VGRGPCPFTEADVRRAYRALRDAGMPITGVRFGRDGFTFLTGKPGEPSQVNSWDEVLKKNEDEQG